MENRLVNADFKFHYVSINSFDLSLRLQEMTDFKFHYVSINSRGESDKVLSEITLNSIMFLLIQTVTEEV